MALWNCMFRQSSVFICISNNLQVLSKKMAITSFEIRLSYLLTNCNNPKADLKSQTFTPNNLANPNYYIYICLIINKILQEIEQQPKNTIINTISNKTTSNQFHSITIIILENDNQSPYLIIQRIPNTLSR